jgi:hypothetical protein
MNRLTVALLVGIALVATARADMYPDASNAVLPVARTNLGLGTMATQNANAVAITGGHITIGADQAGGVFGAYNILAGNATGLNAIIGQSWNSLAPGTNVLPAGVNGVGQVSAGSNGNQVFGVYGVALLKATGGGTVQAAEFTSVNQSGNAPDLNLPPNGAIGTPTSNVKGVSITCGSIAGTNDCSIGLAMGNETGSPSAPNFNTGEYIQFYRQYGLFIDAMPSGNQTGAVIKSNGNGIGLQLQDTANSNNAAALLVTAANGNQAAITNAGQVYLKRLKANGHSTGPPTATTCGTSPVVAATADDNAGYVTVGSGGTTVCTVNFKTAYTATAPVCVVTGVNAGAVSLTNVTTALFIVTGTSISGNTISYVCLPQES